MIILDLLKRKAESDCCAIKKGDQVITYRQWDVCARTIAQEIDALTEKGKNHILIIMDNSIEYSIAYFSVLYSDSIIVPVSEKSTGDEILRTLKFCETDLIITQQNNLERLSKIVDQCGYYAKVLAIKYGMKLEFSTYENMISNRVEKHKMEYDDVAIMLHTSGSLDHPKRVCLRNEGIIANIESNIANLNLTSVDISLIALPMHFGYCNTAQFLTHVYLGATIVIMEGVFYANSFLKLVEKERITNFTAVPTMLLMLLKYNKEQEYEISSLRYICFGGGKMPILGLEELIKKYSSVGFVQTYGQTECSPRVTSLLPEDSLRKLGSVGKAIPNVTIKVVDEAGVEVVNGTSGEIIVSGPNLMAGYYKNEEATKATIRAGWVYTGDIGCFDEDGFLFIKGRKKNIIICGGLNIYPEEIEQILLQFDGILDAVVYGEEDEMLGEVPYAKIVCTNDQVESNDVLIYCREKLSSYKIPRQIKIVEELLKTYNGKTLRYSDLLRR